jgi:hypothetical protein
MRLERRDTMKSDAQKWLNLIVAVVGLVIAIDQFRE